MKDLEKHLNRLNNLLYMSYKVKKIYLDALESLFDEDLKKFFKKAAHKSDESKRILRKEIIKLGGEPTKHDKLNKAFDSTLNNLKHLLAINDESELLDQVYKINTLSIKAYDDLLREKNLPLSVCRKLIELRDGVEKSMNDIKRDRLIA